MKAFQKMTSMELDDEDKLDLPMAAPMKVSAPQYPWGLQICLTEKELSKLGLDVKDAAVGGMLHGHFMAKVTSISCNSGQDQQSCRIELQITDLEIESEDAENEEEEAAEMKPRSKLRSIYR